MNAAAFDGLNKLTHVYLESNVCINQNFATSTAIATMPQVVGEKCGFIGDAEVTTGPAEESTVQNEISTLADDTDNNLDDSLNIEGKLQKMKEENCQHKNPFAKQPVISTIILTTIVFAVVAFVVFKQLRD